MGELYQTSGGIYKGQGKGYHIEKKGECWERPEEGFIKVNSDGSYKHPRFKGSYGVIARDHEGEIVDGKYEIFYVNNVLSAEAAGLKEGMKLAMERNMISVIFETDSLELYEAIQDDTRIPWCADSLIRELNNMKAPFPSCKVCYISRKKNGAADWIAKARRDKELPEDWVQHIPDRLISILDKDGLPGPPSLLV